MDDFIEFEVIRDFIKIDDKQLFYSYIKEVYKDLSERSEIKKMGISKLTFYGYIQIPVFIAEKLFCTLDNDKDGFLNLKEFSDGLSTLYLGSFEETVRFIFDLYDFDKDSEVVLGDVKVILSYLPLKNEKTQKYQMESLSEIDDILKSTFGHKTTIIFEEFLEVIEKKKSDVFIQLLCFLYEKRPFSDQNVNLYKKTSKAHSNNVIVSSPKKRIPSPSRKSVLSPVDSLMSLAQEEKLLLRKSSSGEKNAEISCEKGMIRMANKLIVLNHENISKSTNSKFTLNTKNIQKNEFESILKNSTDTFNSPSTFLKKKKRKFKKYFRF